MSSVKLGRIFGIKINLHYSWFFVVILLAWSLARDFFPAEYPGFTSQSYWILGGIASLLLFGSVLAHELSHAIVAKYNKLKVQGITLFFFGGIASASEEGLTPKKEFQVAIAGPLFSVALGGMFFLLSLVQTPFIPVFDYLFQINLILAAFNMIPGFPLDGGRVFRSIVWKLTDNLRVSTKYASNLGKAFGGMLAFWGFYNIMNSTGGLWYVLLGGFLYMLAKNSYEQVLLKENLVKVKVKDLMNKNFVKVEPDESIETFVEETIGSHKLFIIPYKGDVFVIDFGRLRQIPRHQWPVVILRDVMVKVKPLRETYDAFKALVKMQEQNANMLPVVKNDRIIGVITLDHLFRNL